MSEPWKEYETPKESSKDSAPWEEYANKPSVKAVSELPKRSGNAALHAGNYIGGLVRGAGSIGATIMYPWDKAQDLYHGDRGRSIEGQITGKEKLSRNEQRRKEMDIGLGYAGAETDTNMYGAGKLTGEIAGTAGAGGVLANGVLRAAPALTHIGLSAPAITAASEALATGGFRVGAATGAAKRTALRALGGAGAGGAASGMIDPSNTGLGAIVGGALPGVAKVGGKLGGAVASKVSDGAKRLMQSAIKPTIAQLKSGEAATAVETLLSYGINPNAAGVAKLRDLIGGMNDEIANKIANSNATVSKQKVIQSLDDVRANFSNQVSPTADMRAIQATADDFAAHPGIVGDAIPVQMAQKLKQGTYKVLKKKYGQIGSADTEAQKGLARGLKEEIAEAVPGVAGLNAAESKLITTLNVAERRALMEMNKNPMGLAALAQNPVSWAMFMADKSVLFKSMAARMMSTSAGGIQSSSARLEGIASLPMLRSTAPVAVSRE